MGVEFVVDLLLPQKQLCSIAFLSQKCDCIIILPRRKRFFVVVDHGKKERKRNDCINVLVSIVMKCNRVRKRRKQENAVAPAVIANPGTHANYERHRKGEKGPFLGLCNQRAGKFMCFRKSARETQYKSYEPASEQVHGKISTNPTGEKTHQRGSASNLGDSIISP